jgi:hypothetical protein
MRQVSFFLCCAVVSLSGCQSAPERPQTSWRDEASKCYALAQRGDRPTFQGRSGVAACDRYVEQARYDEAEENARRNALEPLLLQQMMRPLQPVPRQNPPVNCSTNYYGNQAYTQCR